MPPESPARTLYENILQLMPLWVAIGAFYLEAATLIYFLLVLSFTPFVFDLALPQRYSETSFVLSSQITIGTALLFMRKVFTCGTDTDSPVAEDPAPILPTALTNVAQVVFVMIMSSKVCTIFIYGIMSIRGLSHAQMGRFGETVEQEHGNHLHQADPPQPEVVFDTENPSADNNDGNREHRGSVDIV